MPHTDPEITRTTLARDAVLVVDDAKGAAVAVDTGVIWLTLQDDTRDIFVAAGERFRIDRPGRTVIMAHEPASLRLLRPRRFRVVRTIGAALARGLRRVLAASPRRTVPYY